MQACILHTKGQSVPLLSESVANPHRESQLWTSHRSQAPQHSASRGNYQLWVQTSRWLEWLHAPAVLTVSLLSRICSAVTLPCSQSPLQLISPQEAASQTGQWRKMGAGRERGAHSLGHEHTVRITQLPESEISPHHCPWPPGMSIPGLLCMSKYCTAMPQH